MILSDYKAETLLYRLDGLLKGYLTQEVEQKNYIADFSAS